MENLPNQRKIDKTIEINAAVENVWKAITDPEEITRWFSFQAEVTPGTGGKIKLAWDHHYLWEFQIKSWEENKHLQLSYAQVYKDDYENKLLINENARELMVDYYLESRQGRTTLRLVHSGFGPEANWDEEFDGTRRGWNQELLSLKIYLENHFQKNRNVIWVLQKPQRTIEQIWDSLMKPGGLLGFKDQVIREGDQFEFNPDADNKYFGKVLYYNPPRDFLGIAENLAGSLFRVKLEEFSGKREVDIWISSYELEPQQVSTLKTYWESKLAKLI